MTTRYAIALLVLLAACGNDPGAVNAALTIRLAVISGNGQVDTVAQQLAQPITARATDSATARAAPGVVLNWFRVVGPDSTFMGAGITNDSGIARLQPALSSKAGAQQFVGWALDDEGKRAVYVAANATAMAAAADTMWSSRADTLVAPGGTFAIRYGYRDRFGNGASACDVGLPWFIANYLNDTVTVKGNAVAVDNVTLEQTFQMSGPDNTAISVEPVSACSKHAGVVTVRYSH